MPTVKDIAKRAGVSPATVSLALNGKSVSQKALRKVLRAAEDLEYQPKLSARSLRSGKMMSVGFYVVEESFEEACNSGYLFPLVAGISNTLSANGYSLQFESFVPEKIEIITKKALEQSVDAMIVLPHYQNVAQSLLSSLDKTQIPIVFLQCETALDALAVTVDNAKGARLALSHLCENGHVDIGVIAGPSGHVDSVARLDAYRSLASELNLTIQESWIQYGDFTIESGSECATTILDNSQRKPTALLCMNDNMAVGAMHAIRQRGLRIPDDISVIGFDDSPVSQASTPRLTTIKQPFVEQGTLSASILLDILLGRPFASESHVAEDPTATATSPMLADTTVATSKHHVLAPRLVQRESVALVSRL